MAEDRLAVLQVTNGLLHCNLVFRNMTPHTHGAIVIPRSSYMAAYAIEC